MFINAFNEIRCVPSNKIETIFQKYCIAVNYQNKRLLEYIVRTRFLHIFRILFWLPLEGLAQYLKAPAS